MALTDEQRRNAAVIIRVGNEVGASSRDILVALMTALQESGLRNLDYGDRDSQGLFQQRPSMDWGSVQQVTNPEYAARAFFLGAGSNKGLLDYTDRNSMSLTQAAQTVQRSAFPDAYAKHEDAARGLLDSLGDGKAVKGTLGETPGYTVDAPTIGEALSETLGSHPAVAPPPQEVNALGEFTNPGLGETRHSGLGERVNPGLSAPQPFTGVGMETQPGLTDEMMLPSVSELTGVDINMENAATGWRADVIDAARSLIGVAYQWGGTTVSGVDCSGLILYAFQQAGIDMPRVSADQARAGRQIDLDQLKPGDLVAWDNSSRNSGADHIALYIGDGLIIEAARPGTSVQISSIYDRGNAWGVRIKE